MGIVTRTECSLSDSLRDHVLSPVETAKRRVDKECTEVGEEQRAYEQFKTSVAGVDTVTAPQS